MQYITLDPGVQSFLDSLSNMPWYYFLAAAVIVGRYWYVYIVPKGTREGLQPEDHCIKADQRREVAESAAIRGLHRRGDSVKIISRKKNSTRYYGHEFDAHVIQHPETNKYGFKGVFKTKKKP